MLVHAFVMCRLDNCNSLLYGLPKHMIHRLQLVQNYAAHLILCGAKHDRITPLLASRGAEDYFLNLTINFESFK